MTEIGFQAALRELEAQRDMLGNRAAALSATLAEMNAKLAGAQTRIKELEAKAPDNGAG